MKLRSTYTTLITAVALMLAMSACHSNKQPGTTGYENVTSDERSVESVYTSLTGAYQPWSDVQMPVKMSLTEPRRISVSGTLNMQYGKAMSISLKALFFEIATIYADNDSLVIVSKMADAYFSESLESLRRYSGLDLRDMQSLLLGQLFVPGGARATSHERKKFDLTALTAGDNNSQEIAIKLVPRNLPAGVNAYFTAIQAPAVQEPALLRSLDLNANTSNLKFGFHDTESTPVGPAASELEINAGLKERKFKAGVTLNYGRATWGRGSKIEKPAIPHSARRLTFAQIYKLMQSL
ncbi:MAG: DUF4292 domain-containing protein [Muribaculaceae bacterium]|nr:DUF4292 domain-containing protein [Muribaculaceae bacterium]